MNDILMAVVGAAKHAWPIYLAALIIAESLLYLKDRAGMRLVILASGILLVGLTILAFFGAPDDWNRQNRPVLVSMVNTLSILGPLAVVVGLVWLLGGVRSTSLRHAALGACVLVIMLAWPLWALLVTCSSGLDCL